MMRSLPLAGYRLAARAAERLFVRGGAAASLAGRRAAVERWRDWARRHRGAGPLVWIHAASVGEALTAEPVVRRLRALAPGLQSVLTYTSPSLARWPGRLPVAAADFAPPEEPRAVAAVLAALDPDALVFSRTDLWPELLLAAAARGTTIAVIGGTVRAASLRLAWPVRPFLAGMLRPIRFVGAVTAADAARFERLGAPGAAVTVTGDPRHDQVLERVADLPRIRNLLTWAGTDSTVVAGSVEEPDEGPVFDAFTRLVGTRSDVRLLLVPHEPTPGALRRLLLRAARAGVAAQIWNRGTPPGAARCLVAAEVGGLADLYLVGTVAYVGGGFGRGGLHAVIEPAACGVPVAVGPRHRLPDAERLLACGGAVALPRHGAARALAAWWEHLLANRDACARAGLAARAALRQGAADLTARRLQELLEAAGRGSKAY